MSIFSSLTTETKILLVTEQKRSCLERSYLYLIRLGINPETFDKDSYVPQSEDSLEEGDIYSQRELIKSLADYELLVSIEESINSATPNS